MNITALMITPARVAFGMYAKVEVRRPRANNTIAPKTKSFTVLLKFYQN
jgi:hypothetical protein